MNAIFAAILHSAASAHRDAMAIQRAAYITALKRHDWSHEMSDDHSRYVIGRQQLAELRMVQREIDSDYSLWNQHAPAQCRDGKSYA
jgi:hypothetical protein